MSDRGRGNIPTGPRNKTGGSDSRGWQYFNNSRQAPFPQHNHIHRGGGGGGGGYGRGGGGGRGNGFHNDYQHHQQPHFQRGGHHGPGGGKYQYRGNGRGGGGLPPSYPQHGYNHDRPPSPGHSTAPSNSNGGVLPSTPSTSYNSNSLRSSSLYSSEIPPPLPPPPPPPPEEEPEIPRPTETDLLVNPRGKPNWRITYDPSLDKGVIKQGKEAIIRQNGEGVKGRIRDPRAEMGRGEYVRRCWEFSNLRKPTTELERIEYSYDVFSVGPPPPPPPSAILISGLSKITTQDAIQRVFSTYGRIAECTIKLDPQTGGSLGLCWIKYVDDVRDLAKTREGVREIERRRAFGELVQDGNAIAKGVVEKMDGKRFVSGTMANADAIIRVELDGDGMLTTNAVKRELDLRYPPPPPVMARSSGMTTPTAATAKAAWGVNPWANLPFVPPNQIAAPPHFPTTLPAPSPQVPITTQVSSSSTPIMTPPIPPPPPSRPPPPPPTSKPPPPTAPKGWTRPPPSWNPSSQFGRPPMQQTFVSTHTGQLAPPMTTGTFRPGQPIHMLAQMAQDTERDRFNAAFGPQGRGAGGGGAAGPRVGGHKAGSFTATKIAIAEAAAEAVKRLREKERIEMEERGEGDMELESVSGKSESSEEEEEEDEGEEEEEEEDRHQEIFFPRNRERRPELGRSIVIGDNDHVEVPLAVCKEKRDIIKALIANGFPYCFIPRRASSLSQNPATAQVADMELRRLFQNYRPQDYLADLHGWYVTFNNATTARHASVVLDRSKRFLGYPLVLTVNPPPARVSTLAEIRAALTAHAKAQAQALKAQAEAAAAKAASEAAKAEAEAAAKAAAKAETPPPPPQDPPSKTLSTHPSLPQRPERVAKVSGPNATPLGAAGAANGLPQRPQMPQGQSAQSIIESQQKSQQAPPQQANRKTKWTDEEMVAEAKELIVRDLLEALRMDLKKKYVEPKAWEVLNKEDDQPSQYLASLSNAAQMSAEGAPMGLKSILQLPSFAKRKLKEKPVESSPLVKEAILEEEEELPEAPMAESERLVAEDEEKEEEEDPFAKDLLAMLGGVSSESTKKEAKKKEEEVKKEKGKRGRKRKAEPVLEEEEEVESPKKRRKGSRLEDENVIEVGFPTPAPTDSTVTTKRDFYQLGSEDEALQPKKKSKRAKKTDAVHLPPAAPTKRKLPPIRYTFDEPPPNPFECGLADDTEDLYYIQLALQRLRNGQNITQPDPPEEPDDPSSNHHTGSARTEGFYPISVADKMSYLQNANKAIVDLSTVATSGIAASRTARANTRRLVLDIEQHRKTAASDTDILKFNQLRARKKQLKFARSPIHSWGLFSMELIPRGEMVIEYLGEVIRHAVADKREKQYERQGIGSSYLFRIDDNLCVDATKKGNLGRLINHCCTPNCTAKVITINGEKKIVIYAKVDIHAGDEITYDYHFPIEESKIPCLCGSPGCRGFLN
ncbi:hypothetical protein BT69DRAFT_1355458 [Atractiella rhizophila]|nr:hypothetical protein BT69DRAFT_1355458 [Atractiella rhizophila]